MLQELLDAFGITDWEAGYYDDTLTCPCGHEIETDGTCPNGCVSPLRAFGLI